MEITGFSEMVVIYSNKLQLIDFVKHCEGILDSSVCPRV